MFFSNLKLDKDFFLLEGTEIEDSLKENRYHRLPLSLKNIEWNRVNITLTDERWVKTDSLMSNERLDDSDSDNSI